MNNYLNTECIISIMDIHKRIEKVKNKFSNPKILRLLDPKFYSLQFIMKIVIILTYLSTLPDQDMLLNQVSETTGNIFIIDEMIKSKRERWDHILKRYRSNKLDYILNVREFAEYTYQYLSTKEIIKMLSTSKSTLSFRYDVKIMINDKLSQIVKTLWGWDINCNWFLFKYERSLVIQSVKTNNIQDIRLASLLIYASDWIYNHHNLLKDYDGISSPGRVYLLVKEPINTYIRIIHSNSELSNSECLNYLKKKLEYYFKKVR